MYGIESWVLKEVNIITKRIRTVECSTEKNCLNKMKNEMENRYNIIAQKFRMSGACHEISVAITTTSTHRAR